MNDESRRLFEELGSTAVKELAFRDSWVFVGAKGIENKSPFEQVCYCYYYWILLLFTITEQKLRVELITSFWCDTDLPTVYPPSYIL